VRLECWVAYIGGVKDLEEMEWDFRGTALLGEDRAPSPVICATGADVRGTAHPANWSAILAGRHSSGMTERLPR